MDISGEGNQRAEGYQSVEGNELSKVGTLMTTRTNSWSKTNKVQL